MQGYHRDVLEHWAPPPPPILPGATAIPHPPPPLTPNITSSDISQGNNVTPTTRVPSRRRTDGRSSSKRHRKVAAGNKDIS